MLRMAGILLAATITLSGGAMAGAQVVTPSNAGSTPADRGDHAAGVQPSAAAAGSSAVPAASANAKTEKQKALAMQADRLFDMATELKAEVDKTNKNILSLKVVEKAEEIEATAKGLRAQAKR